MPQKSLSVFLDLKIHSVSCPGVVFRDKSDLFLEMWMFGKHVRTKKHVGVFPLHINQTFKFEKVFFGCPDPRSLAEHLADQKVSMELIQENEVIEGGLVLATLDVSAATFLYPNPTATPVYGFAQREILLERSIHFEGISPKLEFSTYTTVKELETTAVDELEDRIKTIYFEEQDPQGRRHASLLPPKPSFSKPRPSSALCTRADQAAALRKSRGNRRRPRSSSPTKRPKSANPFVVSSRVPHESEEKSLYAPVLQQKKSKRPRSSKSRNQTDTQKVEKRERNLDAETEAKLRETAYSRFNDPEDAADFLFLESKRLQEAKLKTIPYSSILSRKSVREQFEDSKRPSKVDGSAYSTRHYPIVIEDIEEPPAPPARWEKSGSKPHGSRLGFGTRHESYLDSRRRAFDDNLSRIYRRLENSANAY